MELCDCEFCKIAREVYDKLRDLYFRDYEVEYGNKTFKRVKKNE